MTEFDALFRLMVAAILGAALGFEREITDKPAGLRTHMLVSLGAALFMVGSILLTQQYQTGQPPLIDPTRIGSTIVTGVGFLGAGMIIQSGDRVQGLTTAAGIWVAAAIGLLVGSGYYIVAIFGALLSLFTLAVLGIIERRLARSRIGTMFKEEYQDDQKQD